MADSSAVDTEERNMGLCVRVKTKIILNKENKKMKENEEKK